MDPLHTRPSRLLVGGLGFISLALGLLFALVAFGIVVLFGGGPNNGVGGPTWDGYCSKLGIGSYESQTVEKTVVYVNDGWSGFPPTHHCRVYLVEKASPNSFLSAEEALRLHLNPGPHELLAAGAYPGTSEYAFVISALLLPPALWALWALLTIVIPSRRPPAPP